MRKTIDILQLWLLLKRRRKRKVYRMTKLMSTFKNAPSNIWQNKNTRRTGFVRRCHFWCNAMWVHWRCLLLCFRDAFRFEHKSQQLAAPKYLRRFLGPVHTKTIVNANGSKRKLFYAFRPSVHTKTMKTLTVNA